MDMEALSAAATLSPDELGPNGDLNGFDANEKKVTRVTVSMTDRQPPSVGIVEDADWDVDREGYWFWSLPACSVL